MTQTAAKTASPVRTVHTALGRHTPQNTLISILVLIAAMSLLLTGAAAAGTVTVDTAGLNGLATDTTLVPVTITGAHNIVAWQLSVGARDDNTAKIVVNPDSVRKMGGVSTGKIVYWYETSDDRSKWLNGDQTLFYLAVTPRTQEDVDVILKDLVVYEENGGNNVSYELKNGTLRVTGWGTGITAGDADSGATVLYVLTDANGVYTANEDKGIRKISIPGYPENQIIIYNNSEGIIPVPEKLGWWYSHEIYPINYAKGGEYTITFTIPVSELAAVSTDPKHPVTIEDLFVLHSVEGTWYKTPVVSAEQTGNVIQITIRTWTHGAFVLAYDDHGVKYKTETPGIGKSSGSGITMSPSAIIIIAAVSGALVLLILIIVVVRKKKNRDNRDESSGYNDTRRRPPQQRPPMGRNDDLFN